MKLKKSLLIILTLAYFVQSFAVDRRRDQNNFNPGYILLPAPYSIPGIGEGFAIFGAASNVFGTQTDITANIITGDAQGHVIGFQELAIYEDYITIDLINGEFEDTSIQSYTTRGMSSGENDYINLTAEEFGFLGFRTTASFFEKQLEAYLIYSQSEFKLGAIRDRDGVLIQEATNSSKTTVDSFTTGFALDLTDDKFDPRFGIRYNFSLEYSPDGSSDSADFYTSNHNLSGYIPLGGISTFVLNYFKSDANVLSEGDTNFDSVESSLGLDCDSLSGTNKTSCEDSVNNTILSNRYGDAQSLGGRSRLRSYPEGRFSGAHTQFYGAELRLNLTDENTPFDILFIQDVRTSFQTALFYERGSVADIESDLDKEHRDSYGAGIRLVTGSGLVYRFDMAFGDEGNVVSIFFNYPWELF